MSNHTPLTTMKHDRTSILMVFILSAISLSCSKMDNSVWTPTNSEQMLDLDLAANLRAPRPEPITLSEDMQWLPFNLSDLQDGLRDFNSIPAPLIAYNDPMTKVWDEEARSTTKMNVYYLDNANVFFKIVTPSRENMTYSNSANQKVSFQNSSYNSLFRIKSPPSIMGVNFLIQPQSKDSWFLVSQKMMPDPGEEPIVFMYQSNKSSSPPLTISWDLEPYGSGYFYLLNDALMWSSDDPWRPTRGGYLRNSKEKGVVLVHPKDKTYSDRFLVEPQCDFRIGDTTVDINSSYLVVEENRPDVITVSYKNELRRAVEYDVVVKKSYRMWSSFRDLSGLAFKIPSEESPYVSIPTVKGGKLVTRNDTQVITRITDNYINTTLRAIVPVTIPPRTEVTVKYSFSSYSVECPYNTKLVAINKPNLMVDRKGIWHTTMYVDDQLDAEIDLVSIDTNARRTVRLDRSLRSAGQRYNLELLK